jgi:hypothetical protein
MLSRSVLVHVALGLVAIIAASPGPCRRRKVLLRTTIITQHHLVTILILLDGTSDRAMRFGRTQAKALVALLAEAHALSLCVSTRRYVTADDNWSPKLDALASWWCRWAPDRR